MHGLRRGDPRSIGRFQILARVGTGGMAAVYLGRSTGRRAVAVKVMHAEHVGDPEHRERFRREVIATRAVGGLYGPGLLDADPDAPRPWMATEFLPAVSLREAVRRFGPLPSRTVLSLAAALAEALTVIHRAGYVHLDLKPANVLLTADGPRVIDFGIAGVVHAARRVPGGHAGSRGYMSPEQEAGALTGPPSDVFSLGGTLAFACTGGPPAERSPGSIADHDLRSVISACLRPDPAARPGLPELIRQLAPSTSRDERPAWPPRIAEEIRRQAAEAENPPSSVSAPTPVPRRRVLLSAATVLIAGLGVSALILDDDAPRAAPEPAGSPAPTPIESSSAVPSPTAPTHVLEFFLTGDVELTTLTFTVNGKSTTLKGVELPWRTTVDVPVPPPSTTWRLKYRHKPGEVTYRVAVERSLVGYGSGGSTGEDVKGVG